MKLRLTEAYVLGANWKTRFGALTPQCLRNGMIKDNNFHN